MSRGEIINEILAIRDSGHTNMFDVLAVQRLAFDRGFYALVNLIEENRNGYSRFILTGNEKCLGQDEEDSI